MASAPFCAWRLLAVAVGLEVEVEVSGEVSRQCLTSCDCARMGIDRRLHIRGHWIRPCTASSSATILTTHLEEGADVTSSATRILAGHAALIPDKPSKAARVQVIKDKAEAFIVVARTSTSVSH